MEVIHIRTSGMDCDRCTARVQRSLARMDGVGDVLALRKPGLTSVMFDPARVDEREIADAIRAEGFEAEVMSPEETRKRWRELSRAGGPAHARHVH